MSVKKHVSRAVTVVAATMGLVGLTACSTAINGADALNTLATAGPSSAPLSTVGFVAVGPDDAWRAANEADMRAAFTEEEGFDLDFAPAQNRDQESQIEAFNAFVDEGVDVILLSATESSGWEDSLARAQLAEIPVILIDRGIEPDKTNLYATRIAPGDAAAGKALASWALAAFPEGVSYFVLEGPSGSPVVNDRSSGWDGVMIDHPEFVKIGAEAADWSLEQAKSKTATMLAVPENGVSLIVAQNEAMALGAIQAVEEAGLVPGTNVKIVTVGGSRETMQALFDGRLSFVAEYNPLLGQTAVKVVRAVLAGGTIDPLVAVPSATYASITQEQLDARTY